MQNRSKKVCGTVIELTLGDITEMDTGAIVNPANAQLVLGGGVAGAVRRKGGPEIQAECDRIGPVQVGQAAVTTGAGLKAEYVIHAVGPRMGQGDEDRKLASATAAALAKADENGIKSIAFPAISTGIFGYPLGRCAAVMLKQAVKYARAKTDIEKIVFCLYDEAAFNVFAEEFERSVK